MSESLAIDVFWSFRSPWSYLATGRLRQWQDRYQLDVNFRPVYPIAIRAPDFFHHVDPLWVSYFITDVVRVAEFLDLPFVWPNPDPVQQAADEDGKMQTHEVQPYIYRLTRLGVVAQEQGRGIQFADAVSSLIWGGTLDWYQGDHLAKATAKAGLDLAEMDEIIVSESDRLEEVIQENQRAHAEAGHWGVPTLRLSGRSLLRPGSPGCLALAIAKGRPLDRP